MITMTKTFKDRDAGFEAWLSMNDLLVDEFLDFIVPIMPADPFTQDGLRVAADEALQRFATVDDVLAPENRHVYDLFVRYIGETFVRAAGMVWTCHPVVDNGKPYIGVKFPHAEESDDVPTLLTAAVARRDANLWAEVLGYALEDREQAK